MEKRSWHLKWVEPNHAVEIWQKIVLTSRCFLILAYFSLITSWWWMHVGFVFFPLGSALMNSKLSGLWSSGHFLKFWFVREVEGRSSVRTRQAIIGHTPFKGGGAWSGTQLWSSLKLRQVSWKTASVHSFKEINRSSFKIQKQRNPEVGSIMIHSHLMFDTVSCIHVALAEL